MTTGQKTPTALGTEKIGKLLIQYAVPAIIAMTASSLYNMVDSIFIGHGVGRMAISGLALTFPLMNLAAAFGSLVGVGAATLVSVKLGQKDYDTAQRVLGNVLVLNIIIGLAFTVLTLLFLDPILYFFGGSEATIGYARDYMEVILLGNVVTHLYLGLNAVLRSAGHPQKAMYATIATVVINTILDPLFIFVFDWGIRGAAIATIVGYLCSDLYFLWLLHKKSRCLSVKLSQCHVTGRELQQILGVGVTAALSNLMQSLTVIVMNQFLLPYGNDKIAAMGIASKVSMIAQLVLVGFSFGGIPLFGYLYGAKKRDVMRKLIRFCLTFLVSIAVVLSLILCLNSGVLMRLFVQDAGMIATGAQMLRWQVYTAAFGGVVLLLTVLFQATGKIVPSFLLSISRQGVVFLLALVVCVHLFQYQGVLMAQAVADILSAALALGLLAANRDIIAKQ